SPSSLYAPRHHQRLSSSPTRRSSDLAEVEGIGADAVRTTVHHLNQRVFLPRLPAGRQHHEHLDSFAVGALELHLAHLAQRHPIRSEEHTSELQSLTNLVCRLLLAKQH